MIGKCQLSLERHFRSPITTAHLIWLVSLVFLYPLASVGGCPPQRQETEKTWSNRSAFGRYATVPHNYLENKSCLVVLRTRPENVIYAAHESDWEHINFVAAEERLDFFRWHVNGHWLPVRLVGEQSVFTPRDLAWLIVGNGACTHALLLFAEVAAQMRHNQLRPDPDTPRWGSTNISWHKLKSDTNCAAIVGKWLRNRHVNVNPWAVGSFELFTQYGSLLLGRPRLQFGLSGQFRLTPNSSEVLNFLRKSELGLLLGGFRQVVSIGRTRVHFVPLETNEQGRDRGDSNSNTSPPNSRPLKRTHPLFYVLELLFGCWLWWRGIYWLGFLDRRGLYGCTMTAGGFLISIHAGFLLMMLILYHKNY
jgi:hypothetical protein